MEQKANLKAKPKTPASVPEMFILIGVGELKCIIEVHLLTFHVQCLYNTPQNTSSPFCDVFSKLYSNLHFMLKKFLLMS